MGERRRPTGSLEIRRTTGSNDAVDRLFVYSTLRTGQTARSLIASHIVRCVPASTVGTIYAFPMGYAGFVAADAPARVIGEVIWLTDLPATFGLLDAYEGEEFARVLQQALLDTGEAVWAWIYVLAEPEMAQHGSLIEHGDWERFSREQR